MIASRRVQAVADISRGLDRVTGRAGVRRLACLFVVALWPPVECIVSVSTPKLARASIAKWITGHPKRP